MNKLYIKNKTTKQTKKQTKGKCKITSLASRNDNSPFVVSLTRSGAVVYSKIKEVLVKRQQSWLKQL